MGNIHTVGPNEALIVSGRSPSSNIFISVYFISTNDGDIHAHNIVHIFRAVLQRKTANANTKCYK